MNQSLPDAAAPNNVLAPFWTDLNPATAGGMYIDVLSDGANDWLVLEWAGVREYGTASNPHSFQIWIGLEQQYAGRTGHHLHLRRQHRAPATLARRP